jgi:HAE1 family hydrophobic/amphiphilic exporter-1
MAVSALLVVATFYQFATMPKGFIPSQDVGYLFGVTEANQDISFESMVEHQQQVMKVLRADPAVEGMMSFVGTGLGGTSNSGRFFLHLKPRHERKESVDELIQKLRPKVAAIPGLNVYMQNPPPIRIGGQLTRSLYQVTLQGPDTDELYKWVPPLVAAMSQVDGLQDVNSDLQLNSPQVTVNIDRDRALALGVTAEQIQNALYTAYGNRQISTIYTPSNQYQVIAEVEPEAQRSPEALGRLYIRSSKPEAGLVPLAAVAKLERTTGPLTITHAGQMPAVTVSFNLRPGYSLGDATNEVERIVRELRMPPTISMNFQGTAQAFQNSFKGLSILLIVAILVIYLVLGVLYESFIHPLTILSGLPSAVVGALATLQLFKLDIDLYAFVGLIMLFGIVKKNAIMMIDFALEAQRKEASRRIRPSTKAASCVFAPS